MTYYLRMSDAIMSSPQVTPLNIRIQATQRVLIEQAAANEHKTVSEFVRDAAMQAASQSLLDKTFFALDEHAWQQFNTALDQVPSKNTALEQLLSRQPVWSL